MSVTVKYTGPSPEVEIPDLRLVCKHGETVEVPTAELAASLISGGDWESSSATVKKAAKEYAASLAGDPSADVIPADVDPVSVAPTPVAPVEAGAPIPVPADTKES